ncbi:MAG: methyltransferase domain-containing protein [Armatimonadota bacterium]
MPTSVMTHVSEIMLIVDTIHPNKVLDVGIGCGKYGFLCRESMEICAGRLPTFSTVSKQPSESKYVIDGVEVFSDYVTPIHHFIYNNIHIGRAQDILPTIPDDSYDLLLAIDVIEHMPYEGGVEFLKHAVRVAGTVLVVTPKEHFEQGSIHGNKYEAHVSEWNIRDFKSCGSLTVMNYDQAWFAMFGSSEIASRTAKRMSWRRRWKRYIPEAFTPRIFTSYLKRIWPRHVK